jgi:micrococcal nuclease
MNKRAHNILIVVVLVVLGLVTDQLRPRAAHITGALTPPAPKGYVMVAKAIDGDTLELADGRMVRYLGIDTPETVDPRKPVQCFGHEASDYNRSLVQGKAVRLVKDIEDTDKYGRLLRYIYLEDGTMVNLTLVAGGYARSLTWPPNITHAKEFLAAERDARSSGRGLWSTCEHLAK